VARRQTTEPFAVGDRGRKPLLALLGAALLGLKGLKKKFAV